MGSDNAGTSLDIVTANGSDSEEPKDALSRRLSVGQRKMATLPTSSVLHYLANTGGDRIGASVSDEWPVLECQNIFILPGVPSYFEKKIKQLAAYIPTISSWIVREPSRDEAVGLSLDRSAHMKRLPLETSPPPRGETYRIVLALKEDEIVSALNAAVAAHPHVTFGSYPLVLASSEDSSRTIITLEGKFCDNNNKHQSSYLSKDEMDRNVEIALEDLKSTLPKEGILCVDTVDDLILK
jgi:molybdopterin-biosynthesis enzyme MoeA-like protein